jgi:hypothetical protein
MSSAVAVSVAVSLIFIVLGLWHFYMAFTGVSGKSGAVPSADGKPLFMPSTKSTVAVGIVLILFAVLVAATSGMLLLGVPTRVLTWLSYALAVGLFARAVGEFKYVGFFKTVRDSRFATMDTLLYSPLCLLLAAGVAVVALHNDA